MKEDVEYFHHISLPKPVPITEQVWPEGARPIVSIACITYNHEEFIEDAIEGFLMQETTFPVEILIHEDASSDKTADIVKEYERKYPQLIKPIYQKENQYSKGNKPGAFNRERAEGKYIAMCEGDDYWIDPYKLKKQVEVLENNVNVSLCCHPAYERDYRTGKKKIICENLNHDGILATKEIIKNRGGFIPTASILFRNGNYKELYNLMKSTPIGDFFLQSYLALIGDVYYLSIKGCVYRRNTENSWTDRQNKIEKKIEYYNSMFHSIDSFYSLKEIEKKEYLVEPLSFYLVKYAFSFEKRMNKLVRFYEGICSIKNAGKTKVFLSSLKYIIKNKFSNRIRRS